MNLKLGRKQEIIRDDNMRWCNQCNQNKEYTEFYQRKESKNGLDYICKKCRLKDSANWHHNNLEKYNRNSRKYYHNNLEKSRARGRKWYHLHPEKGKAVSLMCKYGLSKDEYDNLLNHQNGVCAICGKPEHLLMKGKIKALSVDHSHKTGKVRGLICNGCNTMLGLIENRNLDKILSYINEGDK